MMKNAAIVTGASGGIGRSIARGLALDGWSVLINYYSNKDCAIALENELTDLGCLAVSFCADVSDREQVNAMLDFAESRLGRIELVVNNAGTAFTGLFQDTDDETWERIMNVNLNGARNVILSTLPGMLARKHGSIINVSSIWGIRGASCEVAYACSKAAIVGLTRSLAAELAPSGIRVNCVAPGCIATDMTLKLGADTIDILKEETPLGRLGTPEDVADAVRFLASDASSFMTGQVLTIDGGFTV